MLYRAFVEKDASYNLQVTYYHKPRRWLDNNHGVLELISEENWSPEIKYLDDANENISNEIKTLPNNTGGIYVFYLKGISIPFLENYILYIGRSRYTSRQNIRKRANEYFSDGRDLIQKMFQEWKSYIYYRYFPKIDNYEIDRIEAQLIRAILPPLNEKIPDRIEIQPTITAFN